MIPSDIPIIRHLRSNTKIRRQFGACFGAIGKLFASIRIDRAYQAVLYLHHV